MSVQCSRISFFGFRISVIGLSPDKKKVEVLGEEKKCSGTWPVNAGEMGIFLGLVNYCA